MRNPNNSLPVGRPHQTAATSTAGMANYIRFVFGIYEYTKLMKIPNPSPTDHPTCRHIAQKLTRNTEQANCNASSSCAE